MSQSLNNNILDLFNDKELVKICAPMVRYSKLQFRNLVKQYNCDLAYTPMILADSFCKSSKARNNEFTTNLYDTPLIVQFAANTVHDFVGAAYLASPYCNGVDLNCGCPQKWARQQGLGCALLEEPQIIYNIVRECRNTISKPFTVSVKLRISKELRKTVEISRQLEKCGVSFLAIHGRNPDQLTGEVNTSSIKLINENTNIPVIANGGIKSLSDCLELQEATNCKGVMVANGLLSNPTLFTGSQTVPLDCVQSWLDICYNSTITPEKHSRLLKESNPIINIPERPFNLMFQCFHHHLVFMLQKILPRNKKKIFNNFQKFSEVLGFIDDYFHLRPRLYSAEEFRKYSLFETVYEGRNEVYLNLKPSIEENFNGDFLYSVESNGKYFKSRVEENDCDRDCDWANMYQF